MLVTSRENFANAHGSVRGSPGLEEAFIAQFESRRVVTPSIALHAVVGGKGPPLLLIPGWPQNWYAWRKIMPTLAERFTVIAADPRGTGLSDKPNKGYDSATQAHDMFSMMSALGFDRFAVVGHDMGMWTGYAMAADYPARIERIALGEAIVPGILPSPLLIDEEPRVNQRLWHFAFNRVEGVNEQLVEGREDVYFGYQLRSKAGSPDALTSQAIDYYVSLLRNDRAALSASFGGYREIPAIIAQNRERKRHKLKMPVFAFAGSLACGVRVEAEMREVASMVTSIVFENCGHFVPEEQPKEFLDNLLPFLEPYRQAKY